MANISTYAQLNIGRNVGDVPMSDANWSWFKDSVADALASSVRMLHDVPRIEVRARIETHSGLGQWGEIDPEESAHISIYWPGGLDVDYINDQARTLAAMFDQDAIAVIIGSTLATPRH